METFQAILLPFAAFIAAFCMIGVSLIVPGQKCRLFINVVFVIDSSIILIDNAVPGIICRLQLRGAPFVGALAVRLQDIQFDNLIITCGYNYDLYVSGCWTTIAL